MTSIPLSPSFPVFSKPLHTTYYPNSGYLETETYFTPFGQQDTSPNFNYFAASLPQTPTSIKTGLTLDPYFSHEGIKKLDIKPYTIWITDVTTWQEQGSSTIPYHSDYQQQFISHCQQIWDGWGVDTRVVIPGVAYLSNNHTRFILVINQLDAQNFVLQ